MPLNKGAEIRVNLGVIATRKDYFILFRVLKLEPYGRIDKKVRCGVMAMVLYCSLEVREFEFHLHFYDRFWTNTIEKSMKPLILSIVPQG